MAVFIVLVAVAGFINNYVYKTAVDVFQIDTSTQTAETAASELLNTTQNHNFRLVNVSGITVKLRDIRLEDYKGMEVGSLKVEGKPFTIQDFPSNRVHSGAHSWSTDSQGTIVEYNAKILEPVIQNPRKVVVKYSYLGITHTQVVKIP